MTDFRFNLNAIKLKKVIAMVMAVCLMVITVSVDALAMQTVTAKDDFTADVTADGGIVEVEVNADLTKHEDLSALNGELNVVSANNVKVNSDLKDLMLLKDLTQKVSAVNGVVTGTVKVEIPANETYNVAQYDFNVAVEASGYLLYQHVTLTQDRKSLPDYVSSDDGTTVTDPSVDGFPVYTEPVTTDLDGSGLTTALDGKNIVVKPDNKLIVTVYDGIANGKNLMGNEIAVFNVDSGDALKVTAKIQSLYSLYNGGKQVTGFMASKHAPAKINYVTKVNGKAVKDENYGYTYFAELKGGKYATASDRVTYASFPASTTTNLAVMAVWGAADVTPVNGAVVTDISIAQGQTAVVNYVPTVEKGSKVVVKVTSLDGISVKDLAKKAIKSAKADAKKGTLTLVASKTADFQVGRVTLVTVETQKKVGRVWTTVASTEFKVTNVGSNVVTSSNGLVLKELYGKSSLNFDKAAAKQTGTLVVEKENAAMSVKFYAIDATTANAAIINKLNAGTFDLNTKVSADKAVAKLLKTGKVVKVDANGHVTANNVGDAYVYAVAAIKDTNTKTVTHYVASNGFPVSVKSTLVSFKLSGSKTFAIGKTVSSVNAKPVTITVTKNAKDATDVVSMKVYNAATGKIVLGGATNGMTFKAGAKANTYTYSFENNKAYDGSAGTPHNQLGTYLISGLSPAGDRQTVQISVVKKTK